MRFAKRWTVVNGRPFAPSLINNSFVHPSDQVSMDVLMKCAVKQHRYTLGSLMSVLDSEKWGFGPQFTCKVQQPRGCVFGQGIGVAMVGISGVSPGSRRHCLIWAKGPTDFTVRISCYSSMGMVLWSPTLFSLVTVLSCPCFAVMCKQWASLSNICNHIPCQGDFIPTIFECLSQGASVTNHRKWQKLLRMLGQPSSFWACRLQQLSQLHGMRDVHSSAFWWLKYARFMMPQLHTAGPYSEHERDELRTRCLVAWIGCVLTKWFRTTMNRNELSHDFALRLVPCYWWWALVCLAIFRGFGFSHRCWSAWYHWCFSSSRAGNGRKFQEEPSIPTEGHGGWHSLHRSHCGMEMCVLQLALRVEPRGDGGWFQHLVTLTLKL